MFLADKEFVDLSEKDHLNKFNLELSDGYKVEFQFPKYSDFWEITRKDLSIQMSTLQEYLFNNNLKIKGDLKNG